MAHVANSSPDSRHFDRAGVGSHHLCGDRRTIR